MPQMLPRKEWGGLRQYLPEETADFLFIRNGNKNEMVCVTTSARIYNKLEQTVCEDFLNAIRSYPSPEATSTVRQMSFNRTSLKEAEPRPCQVARLFVSAYAKAATVATAMNAFAKTGIWPCFLMWTLLHLMLPKESSLETPPPSSSVAHEIVNYEKAMNDDSLPGSSNSSFTVTPKDICPVPKKQRKETKLRRLTNSKKDFQTQFKVQRPNQNQFERSSLYQTEASKEFATSPKSIIADFCTNSVINEEQATPGSY
ncbi:hypothetical protein ILUMI_21022 [Ignelater luminosus]|uniref:Uncharacterized protein n=1 Tax=Ignelater luminosus TaxID=2038154 RepID=A0A8K0CHA3_IGNLU|nr:hypothetical protein ILUMI_21022 [Ignelater luminosus]